MLKSFLAENSNEIKSLSIFIFNQQQRILSNITNFSPNQKKEASNSTSHHIAVTNLGLTFNNLNSVLNQKDNFRIRTIGERQSKQNTRTAILKHATNLHKKMTEPNINYFGHTFIDRSSDKRKDAAWIERQLSRSNTVFVLFHVDKPFVTIRTG